MVEIPSLLRSLFSAPIKEQDGTYIVEVPSNEIDLMKGTSRLLSVVVVEVLFCARLDFEFRDENAFLDKSS